MVSETPNGYKRVKMDMCDPCTGPVFGAAALTTFLRGYLVCFSDMTGDSMSKERYISISNGDLTIITENDGYSQADRGAEREERKVTLEELKGTRFYDDAKSLLAKAKSHKGKRADSRDRRN